MKSRFPACVKMLNGAPTVHVNGKPVFLAAPYLAKAPYESFASARSGVFMVFDHAFDVEPPGRVDAGRIEAQIDDLLARDPDALVIVRSFPPAPDWWLDAHPNEVMQFDLNAADYAGYAKFRDVSWGSEVWLDAVCGWYRQLCRRLHDKYEGRVIGYQFGMGSHGENNPIGSCTHDGRWFCHDFSPAMANYFRGWLKQKYGTDSKLRKAWGDPGVKLADAAVPDRLERLRTEWFTFRDPRRCQSADYYQAFAERVEQIVIRICESIKAETGGDCLAGSHLGALLDNGFHGYIYHQACINMVRRALAHPAVDMFTSPASYESRGPGGDTTSMMPTASYNLHGKLIYQDQDTRTFHLPPDHAKGFILFKLAANLQETEGELKRDIGNLLIRGHNFWWHPMVPGMYDHPGVGNCIAKLTGICRTSLHLPRGTAPGFAVIVDEESAFHQQCANRIVYAMNYFQRQRYFNRTGCAWNAYLHNDLAHPEFPRHKMYLFTNTFYHTDEEVEDIRRHLAGSGATVVWTYAPAIQSPAGLDLERSARLTGFRLKALDIEALPRVTFTNLEHPFVRNRALNINEKYNPGSREPLSFGTGPMGNDERERVCGPIIYVDDPGAEVIGELDCVQKPGFCVKQMDGWTSVYSAAPMLNQHLLRNIAAASGIHVYNRDNEVCLPGKSFLMLHAAEAGVKRFSLPAPADVYECYEGRLLGRGLTEFEDRLERFATGLYFIGDLNQFEQCRQ